MKQIPRWNIEDSTFLIMHKERSNNKKNSNNPLIGREVFSLRAIMAFAHSQGCNKGNNQMRNKIEFQLP